MIKCFFEGEECDLDQETIIKMIKRLVQKEFDLSGSKNTGYNSFCKELHSHTGECVLLVDDYKFLITEADKSPFVIAQEITPERPTPTKVDVAQKILTSVGIVLQVVLFAVLWHRMNNESI